MDTKTIKGLRKCNKLKPLFITFSRHGVHRMSGGGLQKDQRRGGEATPLPPTPPYYNKDEKGEKSTLKH